MKNIFQGILVFFCGLVILSTPFSIFNIKSKIEYLNKQRDFEKIKVKVDSTKISKPQQSKGSNTSEPSLIYNFYFANGQFFELTKTSNPILPSDENLVLQEVLNHMKNHNDSIWVWNHPEVRARYARPDETKLNTDGFVTQIIINFILILIAICAVIWQIRQWRKPKTK